MRRIVLMGLALALGACQQQNNLQDLEAYVAEVKARPPGGVSPAPEPVEVDTYLYVPDERRDPFTPEVRDSGEVEQVVESGLRPDPNRRKEELEFYDLDNLRMVGTLEQDGTNWGLVKTNDGTIHRVAIGNYMGRNNGRIVEISEDKIKLVELVQVGSGYQEQEAALGLGEGNRQ